MRTLLVLCVMLVLVTAARGEAPLNILFYGNSYSISPEGIPVLLQRVTAAAGIAKPNCENASVATYSLSKHLEENTGTISKPEDVELPDGFQWDYVVIQDHSVRPTEIPWKGDAAGYQRDVKALFELVRAHSPEVVPVVVETWARSPLNEKDLTGFYPEFTAGREAPYTEAAEKMQQEVLRNTVAAAEQIGARLALAGEAFKAAQWEGLYDKDLAHPSTRGQLLATLTVFEAIYGRSAKTIPYEAMDRHAKLSRYRIHSADDWAAFTAAVANATAKVGAPASR